MSRHVGQGALGVVVLLLAGDTSATGQDFGAQATRQLRALYADKSSWTPAQRKLATSLLFASRDSQGRPMVQGMGTDQDLALLARVASRAGVDAQGMVTVDMRANVTERLLDAVGRMGGKVVSAYPAFDAVRVRIPIRRVEALAALDEVRHVEPKQAFLLNAGSATSQGDAAHGAAAARTSSGLDGRGVKIGILSDGVDNLGARQTSGDLPPTCGPTPGPDACVHVVQQCTPEPPATTCGGEGTAMMEIIHDVAPGAQLYFATANGGDAAFATNILALKNTYRCDIIVDDVTYLNEAAFQDGVIAQAVNAVKNGGGLYFSSAGNSGRKDAGTSGTWEGDWRFATWIRVFLGGGSYWFDAQFHSFNGATGIDAAVSEQLTSASPGGNVVTLKWSDPLGAAASDYDLFAYDLNRDVITDASMVEQDGNDDPIEAVAATLGERVMVAKRSGNDRALRIDTNRGRLSISTAGAVVGHNGGDSTISVAATDGRIPGTGNPFAGGAANPIESFSSDGPRRIFYNPNGTAITPGNVLINTGGGRVLEKPDITAADCVTTGYPSGAFNPFCGTSAAAPHAAAIAALLLSAPHNPSAGQALAALFGTALDVTPGTGRDRNSGVGIVMADAALDALTAVPAVAFYTVAPCRVVDTRQTGGALTCGTERIITVAGGACGVPSDAKAVSLNLTVTEPNANGNLRVYAAGAPAPLASNLNYAALQTRANNAIAPLNAAGQLAAYCSPAGTAQVIVDVNGYFK